jgi:hypothetical protein
MNLQKLKKLLDDYKTITCSLKALEAVKEYGDALQYVNNQTENICLEAVKQKYVKNQTENICLEAVKKDGYALQYVNENIFKNMTEELTLEQICKELGRNIKIIK